MERETAELWRTEKVAYNEAVIFIYERSFLLNVNVKGNGV